MLMHSTWRRALQLALAAAALLALLGGVDGLQPEDRVSAFYQTSHGGWRTPWLDFNLHQMPRFQKPDTFVLQTTLPRKSEKEPEMRLNPEEDVKVSLAFSSSKLAVPNVILYDSKKKRSLQKLHVVFYHDDFDVLRVSHHSVYGRPIQRLDPNHPSLTAFDVVYQWEAVQEDDLRVGILAMFLLTLAALVGTVVYISCTYDRDAGPGKGAKARPQDSRGGMHTSAGHKSTARDRSY